MDDRRYEKVVEVLSAQQCPFYVVFREKAQKQPLHEHSMITSITPTLIGGDAEDAVAAEEEQVAIDWERIGQILLDHRFLPSARLINQALDQLVCTEYMRMHRECDCQ